MSTEETGQDDAQNDDDRKVVTVLIKNPSRDWDDPVEVYNDRDEAEERQQDLGIELQELREVARLVDAPVVDSEE